MPGNDPSSVALFRRLVLVREALVSADHHLERAIELWPHDDLAWEDIDQARLALRVAIDRVNEPGAGRG